jgi:hypothetical protein
MAVLIAKVGHRAELVKDEYLSVLAHTRLRE